MVPRPIFKWYTCCSNCNSFLKNFSNMSTPNCHTFFCTKPLSCASLSTLSDSLNQVVLRAFIVITFFSTANKVKGNSSSPLNVSRLCQTNMIFFFIHDNLKSLVSLNFYFSNIMLDIFNHTNLTLISICWDGWTHLSSETTKSKILKILDT